MHKTLLNRGIYWGTDLIIALDHLLAYFLTIQMRKSILNHGVPWEDEQLIYYYSTTPHLNYIQIN